MSFWVYILQCSNGTYYTGHTDDLEKRIAQHQQGEIKGYSSKRLPINLVFCADFPSRDEAFSRERQIKGWSHRKKQALIDGNWHKLIEYSQRKLKQPLLGEQKYTAHGEQKYTAHGEPVEP